MKKIGLILAAVGCAATLCFAANSISVAKEDGDWIYVYDEKGNLSCSVKKNDGLVGFTSTTVSVRGGSWIYLYDQNCQYIKAISAN